MMNIRTADTKQLPALYCQPLPCGTLARRFEEIKMPEMAVRDLVFKGGMARMNAGEVMVCRQADPGYYVRIVPSNVPWQPFLEYELGM